MKILQNFEQLLKTVMLKKNYFSKSKQNNHSNPIQKQGASDLGALEQPIAKCCVLHRLRICAI